MRDGMRAHDSARIPHRRTNGVAADNSTWVAYRPHQCRPHRVWGVWCPVQAARRHRGRVVRRSRTRSRNAIGRRVRFTEIHDPRAPGDIGPWYEFVGVANDLGMNHLGRTPGRGAGPLQSAGIAQLPALCDVTSAWRSGSLAPRLTAIANAADPTLRLYGLTPMDELHEGVLKMIAIYIGIALLVSAPALARGHLGGDVVCRVTTHARKSASVLRLAPAPRT